MGASRFEAMAFLGWRALVAHPLKLLGQRGSGEERFVANYQSEGIYPTSAQDRAVGEAASACISCGLCELCCDLAAAAPSVRAQGLPAAFRLWSKSTTELGHARAALEACAGCSGCDPVCPTGVPIGAVVRHLLGKVAAAKTAAPAPPRAEGTRAA